METTQRVGANVRHLRLERDLTLAELSEILDGTDRPLSLNILSRIEKGLRPVDVDELVALAKALDVMPEWLLRPTADDTLQLALDEWLSIVNDLIGWDDERRKVEAQIREMAVGAEDVATVEAFLAERYPAKRAKAIAKAILKGGE